MSDCEAVVLDAGPIKYQDTLLFGDMDLEHGLDLVGFAPEATTYRLIEIPLACIAEVKRMAGWRHPVGASYLEAVRRGVVLPPLVVMPTADGGWALLDGVNRSQAYLACGVQKVQAYELLGRR